MRKRYFRFLGAWTVALSIATPAAFAQSTDPELQIVTAGARYLSGRLVTTGTVPSRPAIAIDPRVLDRDFGTSQEDAQRARGVAQLLELKVGTLRELKTCGPDIPGGCRLAVDALFQFGEPHIQGSTATLQVIVWRSNPESRWDATPMAGREMTLVRSGIGWVVTEDRLLFIS